MYATNIHCWEKKAHHHYCTKVLSILPTIIEYLRKSFIQHLVGCRSVLDLPRKGFANNCALKLWLVLPLQFGKMSALCLLEWNQIFLTLRRSCVPFAKSKTKTCDNYRISNISFCPTNFTISSYFLQNKSSSNPKNKFPLKFRLLQSQ